MNPLEDLAAQYRIRRQRDHAARHAADAAARWLAANDAATDATPPTATDPPSVFVAAAWVRRAELVGAVEEFEAARARCARHYTLRLGRLIITATRQHGAPILDDVTISGETRDDDADDAIVDTFTARGYAIRPPLGHYTEAPGGVLALVVAVVGAHPPQAWRIRQRWARLTGPRHLVRLIDWPHSAGMRIRFDDGVTFEHLATAAGGVTAHPDAQVGRWSPLDVTGDGHPLTPGGRDQRDPMNPWPHPSSSLLDRAVEARRRAVADVRDRRR